MYKPNGEIKSGIANIIIEPTKIPQSNQKISHKIVITTAPTTPKTRNQIKVFLCHLGFVIQKSKVLFITASLFKIIAETK